MISVLCEYVRCLVADAPVSQQADQRLCVPGLVQSCRHGRTQLREQERCDVGHSAAPEEGSHCM